VRVCGVELSGNDAVICIMELDEGNFSLPECRVKKITIENAKEAEEIKKFQFTFNKLMTDYNVTHVVIKERLTRGKFAGGAVGFKLEAAIQLSPYLNISMLSSAEIKVIQKTVHFADNFNDTGLKKFQEQAFITAFSYLNKK
jgi:hypothetical protein